MKKITNIKNLLFSIMILNTLDGLFTYYGLINNWIEEANPLLSSLSPLGILMMKFSLSLAVFVLWNSDFPTRFFKGWRVILTSVTLLYIGIMLLHVTWMILL